MARSMLSLPLPFSLVLIGCHTAAAAVLVLAPGGSLSSQPDLVTANSAAEVAGKKVIVTGAEAVPADFEWRSDAKLVVEAGGSIVVRGGAAGTGPLVTGPERIVSAEAVGKAIPSAIGNPAAASTFRVDTVSGRKSATDRNFGLVSQMITGSELPAEAPADPQSDAVAGYFAGYKGRHSANFVTTLNALLSSAIPDKGTVNTSGKSVTRVSGAPFRPDWVNSVLLINNAIYKVAAVAGDSTLTLQSSAGTQTGVPYSAGAGGNALEVDVNSPEDVPADYGGGYGGIVVGSGGPAKALTAISVSATNSPANAWQYGEMIAHYLRYGLLIHAPAQQSASGAYINNGGSGSTTVNGGNPVLVLTGSPKNLLRITPSEDSPAQVVAYGTDSANASVRWSITQGGAGSFSTLTLTNLPVCADNAAARAAGLRANQLYRTPAGGLMVAY